jgi:hypothetical protein
MARIRNIKPEFFSHEKLQDMQIRRPELHPMLVFAALWTQCEWSGVFHWSIRKLRLSILPFLEIDLEKSLNYLVKNGFIKKYSKDGNNYGYIYNFTKYQAISGKEKEQGLKYPLPGTEQNENKTGTILELDENESGSPDSGIDIGHRHWTKDIDINTNGSAESGDGKKPKKLPLRFREPVNDMECVEKAYLKNWDALYIQSLVKKPEPVINWNQARNLLKKHFVKLKPEDIIFALNKGMNDDFVMQGGYSLGTILSASVLNRLINASQNTRLPSVKLPHRIANDNIPDNEKEQYFKR